LVDDESLTISYIRDALVGSSGDVEFWDDRNGNFDYVNCSYTIVWGTASDDYVVQLTGTVTSIGASHALSEWPALGTYDNSGGTMGADFSFGGVTMSSIHAPAAVKVVDDDTAAPSAYLNDDDPGWT